MVHEQNGKKSKEIVDEKWCWRHFQVYHLSNALSSFSVLLVTFYLLLLLLLYLLIKQFVTNIQFELGEFFQLNFCYSEGVFKQDRTIFQGVGETNFICLKNLYLFGFKTKRIIWKIKKKNIKYEVWSILTSILKWP